MNSLEKIVLLPDIHHPYHDKSALSAVFSFIDYFKPNEIVLLGDAMEMRSIDHWKQEKRNIKYFEGKRLLADYKSFDMEILEPLSKLVGSKCRKVYMGGNHEAWAERLINSNPQLEGLLEPENALELEKKGWKWIPYTIIKNDNHYRGMHKVGKLTVFHGNYLGKNHASQTSQSFDKSVAYGHTHDVQMFTKVHMEDPVDYHSAQSIGCLCNRAPEYKYGKPNRWVHAFGITYVRDKGFYNLYVPIIVNGEFVFNEKLFKG